MTSGRVAGSGGVQVGGGALGPAFAQDLGKQADMYQVEAVELYGWSPAYDCKGNILNPGGPPPCHEGSFYDGGAFVTLPPKFSPGGDIHSNWSNNFKQSPKIGHFYGIKFHTNNRDCFEFFYSHALAAWQECRTFIVFDPFGTLPPGGNGQNTYGNWFDGDCARIALTYACNWDGGPWTEQFIEGDNGSTSIGGDPVPVDIGVFRMESPVPLPYASNVGPQSLFIGDDDPHPQWNALWNAPQWEQVGTIHCPVIGPGREATVYCDVPPPPFNIGDPPHAVPVPFVAYMLAPITGYDAAYGGMDGPMSWGFSGPTQIGWPSRFDVVPREWDWFNSACLFFGSAAFSFPPSAFVYALRAVVQRLPRSTPDDLTVWPCGDGAFNTDSGVIGTAGNGSAFLLDGSPAITAVQDGVRLHVTSPVTISVPFVPNAEGVESPWDQSGRGDFEFMIDTTLPYSGTQMTIVGTTPNGFRGGGILTFTGGNVSAVGLLNTGASSPGPGTSSPIDTPSVPGSPGLTGAPAFIGVNFLGYSVDATLSLNKGADPALFGGRVTRRELRLDVNGWPIYDPAYFPQYTTIVAGQPVWPPNNIDDWMANRISLTIEPPAGGSVDVVLYGQRLYRFGILCPDTAVCHDAGTAGVAIPGHGAVRTSG